MRLSIPKLTALSVLAFSLFVSSAYSETSVVANKPVYALSDQEKKALIFDAGPEKNTAVQFFTSDANPACNEAVKWFSTLTQKEGQLWKNFVPIAMHVRLWDSNGYRDVYAKDDFDVFVQSYSRSWGVGRVFAPLIVVNGVEWSGWARGQDVPVASGVMGGMLHVDGTERSDAYNASFKPDSTVDIERGFQLHGAILGFGLQSRPSDGKNRGNVLVHDFIPVLYKNTPLKSGGEGWKASLELPKPKGLQRIRYAAVFWVTKNGEPVPLQSVGGFLPGW